MNAPIASTTRIVAIYGAALASLGFIWQVFTWAAARKNRVTVEVAYGFLAFGPNLVDCVNVTAVNRHDHAIRVASLGLVLQDNSGNRLTLLHPAPGDGLPGDVPAHDSRAAHPRLADLTPYGIDVYRPLRAWIRLGTGEEILSPARTLMKRT